MYLTQRHRAKKGETDHVSFLPPLLESTHNHSPDSHSPPKQRPQPREKRKTSQLQTNPRQEDLLTRIARLSIIRDTQPSSCRLDEERGDVGEDEEEGDFARFDGFEVGVSVEVGDDAAEEDVVGCEEGAGLVGGGTSGRAGEQASERARSKVTCE